jgi:hypothetical protein
VLARPGQVSKLGPDHARHHAGPCRRDEDQPQRGHDVARDLEPFGLIERTPDLLDFGGAQETISGAFGTAGRGKIGERVNGHEFAAGLLRPFEHGMEDMLGLVGRCFLAAPVRNVVDPRGRSCQTGSWLHTLCPARKNPAGRVCQDLVGFLTELQALGCHLYLHQQALDTSTPSGRAMFQMCGVFAEFERGMIRERVNAGLARAKERGTRLGRRPVKSSVEARRPP